MGKAKAPPILLCPGEEGNTAAVQQALGRFYAGVIEDRIRQTELSEVERAQLLDELLALLQREG